MKKVTIASTVALSLLMLSAGAATAAEDTSPVDAEIVAAISITNTVGLNFGQLAPTATAGSVTVSTVGGRTGTNVTLLATGDPATAASFDVAGEPAFTYSIAIASPITITSGANTMSVGTFVTDPTPGGTLDGAGADTLLVGATLSVGANQAAGAYTGEFTATVVYN